MKLTCFPLPDIFCANAQSQPQATHAQLSCSLDFDCLHPMTVLEALQQQKHFFLLESATEEKTISRYSFFGYQVERRFRCLAQPDGTAQLWEQSYQIQIPQGETSQRAAGPERLLSSTADDNPFQLLFQNSIDAPEAPEIIPLPQTNSIHAPKWQGFQGGLVGMFSYESVRHMGVLRQELRQLSTPNSAYGQQPEMLFYEVHRFFVIDNASQRIFAAYLAPLERQDLAASYRTAERELQAMTQDLQQKLASANVGQMLPSTDSYDQSPRQSLAAELSQQVWQEDQSEEQQRDAIEFLRRELIAGEALQVVFSVGRQGPAVSSSLFYRLLRRQNPSPYMFFFKDGQQHLVGSSPETHLRYQDGVACIKPIAGTRPLRENLSADELQEIIDDLLSDPKERAEHLMLIDLARNDLYTNCEPSSVKTVKEFCPEVYSHVVHIVSEVHGRLRAECKPYELFAKTFPAGTLSGAPKVRAIELIDQYEQSPRGFYGGCVGYFNYDGSFDSAIVIRSVWIDGQKTLARSGGGLVYDSEPSYEIREHRQKLGILSRVLQAILQADF